MRESTIEQKLRDAVRQMDGICIKMNSLSMAGLPDRLLLLPGGRTAFVELKRKGEKPSHLQKVVMAMLGKMGFPVTVIDAPEQIQPFLQTIAK